MNPKPVYAKMRRVTVPVNNNNNNKNNNNNNIMIDNDKKGKKIDSPKPLPLKKMSPDIANISGRENCIHVNNDRL